VNRKLGYITFIFGCICALTSDLWISTILFVLCIVSFWGEKDFSNWIGYVLLFLPAIYMYQIEIHIVPVVLCIVGFFLSELYRYFDRSNAHETADFYDSGGDGD